MALSEMQRNLVEAMRAAPDKVWDIDDLATAAYKEKPRPKSYGVSLRQIMRDLIGKAANSNEFRIERVSQLGRAKTALYRYKAIPRSRGARKRK